MRVWDGARFAALAGVLVIAVLATGCSAKPHGADQDRHTPRGVASSLASDTDCRQVFGASPVDQRARSRFPLRVQERRRYLVDARGRPFLLHGDSPWSLIAEPTRSEVDRYLADRKARGFNTLLVNLLEHAFASKAPANAYGDAPFKSPGDFSTPNEAYFAHADWVIRRASSMGFLVLLAPAYIGFRDTSHGWWRDMVASGPEKLRVYGRYLGRRYSRFENIVWVQGGDDDPPTEGLVDALAEGISETDPDALQTGHPAPESATLDTWKARSWLDVNNVYTYKDVYLRSIAEYRRSGLPFFLMESAYEDERPVSTRRIRTQAWHSLLAGATGELFGNNPIWHFSGPGLERPRRSWQQSLNSPGARSMAIVAKLFGSLPWWRLVPDEVGVKLIVEGRGHGDERAVAALACDKRWGLLYVPSERTVTLDMRSFRGSRVVLTWIDPTTGASAPARPGSTRPRGQVQVSTPGKNAAGAPDWVLKAVAR